MAKHTVGSHLVNFKVIQSGSVVELIHYSKGYLKGFNITPSSGQVESEEIEDDLVVGKEVEQVEDVEEPESRESIMIRSSKRASKALVRIVNSNVNTYGKQKKAKFVTLTFAEHVTDLDVANKYFTAFIRRFNAYITGNSKKVIKYSAVWELTKIGRIHYHVVFYNLPYIKAKKINEIWANGNINIRAIDNYENVGQYIAKYMTKPDKRYLDEKYLGKKRYFSSRGLKKPLEITDPKLVIKAIISIYSSNVEPSYSYTYESDELGLITYQSFIIPNLNILSTLYQS